RSAGRLVADPHVEAARLLDPVQQLDAVAIRRWSAKRYQVVVAGRRVAHRSPRVLVQKRREWICHDTLSSRPNAIVRIRSAIVARSVGYRPGAAAVLWASVVGSRASAKTPGELTSKALPSQSSTTAWKWIGSLPSRGTNTGGADAPDGS